MLTDSSLNLLSAKCINLRSFNLSKVSSFSKKALIESFKSLKNLEYLKIERCMRVDDQVLEVISENCKKIKSLDLTRVKISENTLLKISTNLPLLQDLILFACGKGVTDKVLDSISMNNKNLVYISLSKNSIIGNDSLCNLFDKCENLQGI